MNNEEIKKELLKLKLKNPQTQEDKLRIQKLQQKLKND